MIKNPFLVSDSEHKIIDFLFFPAPFFFPLCARQLLQQLQDLSLLLLDRLSRALNLLGLVGWVVDHILYIAALLLQLLQLFRFFFSFHLHFFLCVRLLVRERIFKLRNFCLP